MNRTIRNFFICMAAALAMALAPFRAEIALAATAKITFNDPKPEVGAEFTVTVKAATSDGNLGGADIVLSYDPAVIEFVSGNNANGGAGTVRLVGTMDSSSTKSFDFSLKFKAVQAGSTQISVSSSEFYDSDMQAMTVSHSGSSSVQVQAPAAYSSEASLTSLKISPGGISPAFSPDVTSYTANVGADVSKIAVSAERKDPKSKLVVSGDSNLQPGENKVVCKVTAEDGKTVKNYTIAVTRMAAGETEALSESEAEETQAAVLGELKTEIEGKEYLVASSFDQSLLPAGFTTSTVTYQEQNIMGGENGDLTILYLQDPEGSEGFWFYDAESGEFTRYANIHVSEKNITVLPADEAPEVPEGFAETTIQLNGDYKVEGWVWESDADQRYCVVYGMNENGEKGLYRYDIGEKTIQRYFEDPAVKSSYSDEEVEAFIQEYNDMNQLYRLRLIIIIALGAVCVILIVMVIVLLKKKAGGNGSDHPHDQGTPNSGGSRRAADVPAQAGKNLRREERTERSVHRPEKRETAEGLGRHQTSSRPIPQRGEGHRAERGQRTERDRIIQDMGYSQEERKRQQRPVSQTRVSAGPDRQEPSSRDGANRSGRDSDYKVQERRPVHSQGQPVQRRAPERKTQSTRENRPMPHNSPRREMASAVRNTEAGSKHPEKRKKEDIDLLDLDN